MLNAKIKTEHSIAETDGAVTEFTSALRQALGNAAVLLDPESLKSYSADVYETGIPPVAVIVPTDIEHVKRANKICSDFGAAMIPRGGGMSYTHGYLAVRPLSVVYDMGGLNRIVEINETDMYVTVEAGCTWRDLTEALSPRGLRTPYWGPVSGRRATVGGALSQNSMFWGAVQYGCAAENVLGLDVVLADGSVLSTGAHSGLEGNVPFFRHYGPDLTGVFTSDCGALGIKVRATLPLVKKPSHRGVLSFGFPDVPKTLAFLAGVSHGKLITESAAFDQSQQEQRVARRKLSFKESLSLFASIVRSKGLVAALRTGISQGRALRTIKSSAHVVIEVDGAQMLAQRLREIREIALTHDGWEVEPAIATVLQAEPFPSPSMMLGARGESFVPHHGIVPHSHSVAASAEIASLLSSYAERAKNCTVRMGLFFSALSNSSIVLEPTWYWEDARNSFHNTAIEPEKREKMKDFADNPDARRLVVEIRRQVEDIFHKHSAAHFQIGKYYPYAESRDLLSSAAMTQIKRQFDPKGLMNPGALGW